MKRPSQRPVTVEDLLRLKRAERPPEAFWADFDRGLREKQLAALLPRRPWWQRWTERGFWPAWGRLALPVGAAGLITGLFLVPRPGGESAATPGWPWRPRRRWRPPTRSAQRRRRGRGSIPFR